MPPCYLQGMELPTLNLKELEKLAVEEALRRAGGRVAKAARILGIGRATLYRRLAREVKPVRCCTEQHEGHYCQRPAGHKGPHMSGSHLWGVDFMTDLIQHEEQTDGST